MEIIKKEIDVESKHTDYCDLLLQSLVYTQKSCNSLSLLYKHRNVSGENLSIPDITRPKKRSLRVSVLTQPDSVYNSFDLSWSRPINDDDNINFVSKHDVCDYYVCIDTPSETQNIQRSIYIQTRPDVPIPNSRSGYMKIYSIVNNLCPLVWSIKSLNCTKIDDSISVIRPVNFKTYMRSRLDSFILYLTKKTDLNIKVYDTHCDEAFTDHKYTIVFDDYELINNIGVGLINTIMTRGYCFYTGCINVDKYISHETFQKIDCRNFEISASIISKAISLNIRDTNIQQIHDQASRIMKDLHMGHDICRKINDSIKK